MAVDTAAGGSGTRPRDEVGPPEHPSKSLMKLLAPGARLKTRVSLSAVSTPTVPLEVFACLTTAE